MEFIEKIEILSIDNKKIFRQLSDIPKIGAGDNFSSPPPHDATG